ncbi:MAG: amidohydrolase family protein [Synergistaceae bacterium]|nr:amidohydrolase family protein [Synergistaceae bacterium]
MSTTDKYEYTAHTTTINNEHTPRMRIVDIHTHTFPEKIAARAITSLQAKSHTKAFTDGTIESLSRSMHEAGITYSVIQPVATNPKQVIHVNDSSIAVNESFSETGIMSFGAMHPDFEGYAAELDRLSRSGVKGIKLHPVYQGVSADDERYIRILRKAGELGMIVLLHAGYDIGFPGNDYALPEKIAHALREAGDVRVILAHMGGWKSWREAEEVFSRGNVYIDTAFSLVEFIPLDDGYYASREECRMLKSEEFVRMVHSFGAERVLFGTDSPWASQSETLRTIDSLPLTEAEKCMIYYNNSCGLLGIK